MHATLVLCASPPRAHLQQLLDGGLSVVARGLQHRRDATDDAIQANIVAVGYKTLPAAQKILKSN